MTRGFFRFGSSRNIAHDIFHTKSVQLGGPRFATFAIKCLLLFPFRRALLLSTLIVACFLPAIIRYICTSEFSRRESADRRRFAVPGRWLSRYAICLLHPSGVLGAIVKLRRRVCVKCDISAVGRSFSVSNGGEGSRGRETCVARETPRSRKRHEKAAKVNGTVIFNLQGSARWLFHLAGRLTSRSAESIGTRAHFDDRRSLQTNSRSYKRIREFHVFEICSKHI